MSNLLMLITLLWLHKKIFTLWADTLKYLLIKGNDVCNLLYGLEKSIYVCMCTYIFPHIHMHTYKGKRKKEREGRKMEREGKRSCTNEKVNEIKC